MLHICHRLLLLNELIFGWNGWHPLRLVVSNIAIGSSTVIKTIDAVSAVQLSLFVAIRYTVTVSASFGIVCVGGVVPVTIPGGLIVFPFTSSIYHVYVSFAFGYIPALITLGSIVNGAQFVVV